MNTCHGYRSDKTSKEFEDYFIVFGNSEIAWNVSKEELKEYWVRAVKCSASTRSFGDVTLFYRSKLIRAVNNFNIRLLDKGTQFKCQYKKY